MKFQASSGISFVELVITILLITIIATFAIPQYHTFKAQQERNLSIRTLKTLISYAKQTTQMHHHDMIMCPSQNGVDCLKQNTWQYGILLVADRNKNRQADTNEPRLHFYGQNLQYATLTWHGSLNKNIIVFQSDTGLPRGHIGSFKYCSVKQKTLSYRLSLNMMGHTKENLNHQC